MGAITDARGLEERVEELVGDSELYTVDGSQKRLEVNRFGKTHLQDANSKPKKGWHQVDLLIEDESAGEQRGKKVIVSCKWQRVAGTAEQKVPYEIMCLAHAVKKHRDIVKAYLVIEGEGWTLKELYLQRPPYDRNDGLSGFLKNWSNVEIVDLKGFEERLKAGKL